MRYPHVQGGPDIPSPGVSIGDKDCQIAGKVPNCVVVAVVADAFS